MQYTDAEAALIGGLISTYFFQPAVSASLKDSYSRVLEHLQDNRLSVADLTRSLNALTFLTTVCLDNREAHMDFNGATLKTDALLRTVYSKTTGQRKTQC